MSRIFSNPAEAIVHVVDQNSTLRTYIADASRSLGLVNVSTFSNLKDVFENLETEFADWIVTAGFTDDDINFVHLLKLFAEQSLFKKSRFSLMMKPSEKDFLPMAFEHGLHSFHDKTLSNKILAEIQDLFRIVKENRGNYTLTSARYLRPLLMGDRHYRNLIQLERMLIEMYPANANLLIGLGEALLREGSFEEGRRALLQAKAITPGLADLSMDLLAKFADQEAEGEDSIEFQQTTSEPKMLNVLGVDHAVIIDPDTAVQFVVTNVLSELGVPQVTCFNDGESFYAWLVNGGKPGMILMEWRLAGVSGPMLIQRIRQKGFHAPPVLVISSQISLSDKPLLMEMGVSNPLPKPFENQELMLLVVSAVQQNRAPSEQYSMYLKIRHLLQTSRLDEAAKLISAFIENHEFENEIKIELRARFEFSQGNYMEAKAMAYEALKISRDPLDLLNFHGKTLMMLKDYDAALKCFSKAQSMSPKNIERLSNIATIHIETGDITQAETALSTMKTLDAGNKMVAETDAKIGLATNDVERTGTAFQNIESLRNIIYHLNNKGVAFIKCEKFEEGINLYKTALQALPKNEAMFIATASYNTALAQVKYSEYDGALELLINLQVPEGMPVAKRIQALIKRLEKAIATGQPVELNTGAPEAEATLPTNIPAAGARAGATDPKAVPEAPPKEADKKAVQSFVDGLQPNRGDICCYRIYKANELLTPDCIRLTLNPPRFRRREAIDRPDSLKSKPGAA